MKAGDKIRIRRQVLRDMKRSYSPTEMNYFKQVHIVSRVIDPYPYKIMIVYPKNHRLEGLEWSLMGSSAVSVIDGCAKERCDCVWEPCKQRREEKKPTVSQS